VISVDKAVDKLMETVRKNDIRNLRRQLLRYRTASTEYCNQAWPAGANWSPVTSAADYGFSINCFGFSIRHLC